MKLRFATILCAFAAIFSMASCTEEILGVGELPPLAGEVVLTDVVETSAVRLSPNYVFTLELKSAAGDVLEAKLASSSTALAAGTYTEASPAYAVAGNFITGAEGTKLTVGGETHLVTAGTITVAAEGGNYSLEAIVKLDNGSNYSLTWAGGPVSWGEVLVATKLTKVLAIQENQNKTVKIQLAEETVNMVQEGWTTTYSGNGHYLSVEFFTEDGYLAPGSYTPSANPQQPKKGEYAIGYDNAAYGDYGLNSGSCWWTVADGVTSAEKLTTGNITVSVEGETFVITVDNNEIYAQFVGAIPEITKPATPPVLLGDYPYFVGMTDQMEQYKSVILQFASTDKLKSVNGAWTGTGKLFNLTINAASGADGIYIPTGKYEVGETGADQPFTWQATGGMDLSEWGMGYMYWGTYMSDINDGESTVTELKEGTIWVGAKSGEYVIHMNTQGKEFLLYQGKIKGLVTPADDDAGYVEPEDEGGEGEGEGGACGCDCEGCQDCTGGSGDGGEEAFDGVMLTGLGGWMDYTGWGMPMVGIDLYSDGCTVKMANWQYTYSGTGKHLKLEIYSKDGKIAPGVYKLHVVENNVLPENCIKAGDASGGTEWIDVKDGKNAGATKITDGTVTVEENGGVYTLTIESSVCKARYVGPLAAPAQ